MGLGKFVMNFWINHYNSDSVVGNKNLQQNVGRTQGGNPISDEDWSKSIEYIKSQIDLKKSDDILEVCCGNGMVVGELSKSCKRAKGVDYSDKLLKQLIKKYPHIACFCENVLEYNFEYNAHNKVILYFAAQHFDERDLLILIKRMIYTTKQNGTILIGDIPNESEKWNYIQKPEHKSDYFDRILNGTPMIGNWYSKDWFLALNHYLPNVKVEVMDQPNFMINSNWRFDVIIKKL